MGSITDIGVITGRPTNANERRSRDGQFFELLHAATTIRRHVQLSMWLQGDLQSLLAHDLLLVARGDFAKARLQYDVISSKRESIGHPDIRDLVITLFNHWIIGGRRACSLNTTFRVKFNSMCQRRLHCSLGSMRSVMVQGVRDAHTGDDVLYIAFRADGTFDEKSRRMFDVLLPHIDYASRRIAAVQKMPEQPAVPASPLTGESSQLTDRESEILHWVSNGKTNYEIGLILGISRFTVKNHLQRIFRKIDVSNRAQAVSRFAQIRQQQRQ